MKINRAVTSRRHFLKMTSAAASSLAFWFVDECAAQRSRQQKASLPPSERINLALIGCGGQGRGDARNARRYGQIVAVCDELRIERCRYVTEVNYVNFCIVVDIWVSVCANHFSSYDSYIVGGLFVGEGEIYIRRFDRQICFAAVNQNVLWRKAPQQLSRNCDLTKANCSR